MVNRRRAGFPVPLSIFPFESIVYFHVEGTEIIAEPIPNGVVEACFPLAGRGKLGDTPSIRKTTHSTKALRSGNICSMQHT